MDRHDHVDGQGEDIPLEPALGGPLMAKTTAEEVTSDQPSFRLLPKKDNENNGAYGGGGKYSGARKGSDKTIDMLYMKVIYWGAFRWIVSWVVFGISVSIVASGAVPVVVPYAAFNLVCVSPTPNLLLVFSSSSSPLAEACQKTELTRPIP